MSPLQRGVRPPLGLAKGRPEVMRCSVSCGRYSEQLREPEGELGDGWRTARDAMKHQADRHAETSERDGRGVCAAKGWPSYTRDREGAMRAFDPECAEQPHEEWNRPPNVYRDDGGARKTLAQKCLQNETSRDWKGVVKKGPKKCGVGRFRHTEGKEKREHSIVFSGA
jgi:hypothetical protein